MGKVGKAAIVREYNKPVSVEEITVESPRRGEVMVKIAACGVCHSDYSAVNATIPMPPPLVLGHEAAGVIEEVGEGVEPDLRARKRLGHEIEAHRSQVPARDGQEHACDGAAQAGDCSGGKAVDSARGSHPSFRARCHNGIPKSRGKTDAETLQTTGDRRHIPSKQTFECQSADEMGQCADGSASERSKKD